MICDYLNANITFECSEGIGLSGICSLVISKFGWEKFTETPKSSPLSSGVAGFYFRILRFRIQGVRRATVLWT